MGNVDTGRAERIIAWCREIAMHTEVAGETTRPFLCDSARGVHTAVRGWMEAAGMTVRVDAVGNLRGLYAGASDGVPVLVIGSHLDTVPNAGAFDGPLGVVMGVALVEELRGERLPVAIEVIGFSEEEGVRFGFPFLSSRALAGSLDAAMLAKTDAAGVSVAVALREFGLSGDAMTDARMTVGTAGYLEFHIEQGPVLESERVPLGVVTAIAGQTRLRLTFTGQANHAGTTPMHLRRDAMAAAAHWMVDVERRAIAERELVATVGSVAVKPGAGNVIAGEVVTSLDVRHADDVRRNIAVAEMLTSAESSAKSRGVTVKVEMQTEQRAVAMDAGMVKLLEDSARAAGVACKKMVSGAGHDAMIVAPVVPSAMLFVASPGGLSHHPDEAVVTSDVEAAMEVGMRFVRAFAEAKERRPNA